MSEAIVTNLRNVSPTAIVQGEARTGRQRIVLLISPNSCVRKLSLLVAAIYKAFFFRVGQSGDPYLASPPQPSVGSEVNQEMLQMQDYAENFHSVTYQRSFTQQRPDIISPRPQCTPPELAKRLLMTPPLDKDRLSNSLESGGEATLCELQASAELLDKAAVFFNLM